MIDGRLTRPMAISTPGMFLSQPGIEMLASYHWPCITVSIESAIISRDCRLYRIPVVPIEIASDTPIVLNCIGTIPESATPFFTMFDRSIKCLLHGLPLYHTDDIPTCALFMSASFSPTAYNMACDAPCDFGCVTIRDTRLSPSYSAASSDEDEAQRRHDDEK
ncbi:hypothetical protein KCU88_g816, partial [Aureobasidium melanogenum]